MRYSIVFTLAAASSAFVLPSEQVFAEIATEDAHRDSWYGEAVAAKDSVLSSFKKHFEEVTESSKKAWGAATESTTNAIDQAMNSIDEASKSANQRIHETAFDAQAWLDSGIEEFDHVIDEYDGSDYEDADFEDSKHKGPKHDGPKKHKGPKHDGPKHKGPKHDGPKHKGPKHDGPEHKGPGHKGPEHKGPEHKGPEHKGPEHKGPEHKGPKHDGPKHDGEEHDGPKHDGPPHEGPDSEGPEHEGPPHHGPPKHGKGPHHKRPHHGPHHGKPNATIYELIANSKYTTKLAFLINQYPDLVTSLNTTEANFTLFAPTDKAFDKIPEHAPKPSKEQIEKLLSYHIVPDFYPAGRVLATHTVGTLLSSDSLGSEPLPQRLRLHAGLHGLTVNFYSHIVAVNIFATNGVIHGVDSLIIPPPPVIKIIDLLPTQFSTLELGLGKTGLLEKLNTTKHAGGTFFAPSNSAFGRLGPRANAFLFSEPGLKFLKALLEYHIVPNNTLYSDAFYSADEDESVDSIPKGRFHVDLPTLLKERSLSIDIARFGGFIDIKINGYNRVAVQDGIAKDGVIHGLSSVLIPPRKVGGEEEADDSEFLDEEIEVEELKERLAPFVSKYDL